MTPAKGADEVKRVVERAISQTFKTLLETKHLYQSLEVAPPADDISSIVMQVRPAIDSGRNFREELALQASLWISKRWNVFNPRGSGYASTDECNVVIPHIKTFCIKCDRVEPFNVVATTDYLVDSLDRPPAQHLVYRISSGLVQNFVLSFWCQGCKGVPEVFVIRRVGAKLTLCGRSPMEHVDVPKHLPPKAKEYIAGAIVAHQCGQTLAGLFLLRTSIEQWIRSLGAEHEKADQAIDWYMSTLPEDFKSWAPSLRDLYGTLSDAIHKANASATLFDRAKADIERHFDARRVRALPNPIPTKIA
jgi:hypothetical protein